DDGVDRECDRPGPLAVALEAHRIPRVDPEVLGQPVRRHRAHAVFDRVAAGGGQQGAGREAVDLLRAQPRVGDGLAGRLQRDRAERTVEVPLHLRVAVADDRDLVPHASWKAGTEMPGPTSSKTTVTRVPSRMGASGPSTRRPMRRTPSVSSISTSASTNGTSASKPGRNDWRM